jgi:alpha-D-xyloside xylohydrolase
MFGHALLVKPVTDPLFTKKEGKKGVVTVSDVAKATKPVKVYLPAGSTPKLVLKRGDMGTPTKWYDFYTNRLYDGGQEVSVPTSIYHIPVFVRAGSIMPFGPEVQYSSEKPWDDLEIRVYPGADGSFCLYEDEGDNYNYEQGKFSTIRIQWNDAKRTLTLDARKGVFPGSLNQRTFVVQLLNGQKQTISYLGKKVTVKL